MSDVPEPKEKDWRKARERRLMNISASQMETFDLCERKWWLSKVRKLTDATTKSQVFGTVVHAVIERYLLADDLGRVDCTQCHGKGEYFFMSDDPVQTACLKCNGTGKVPVDLYPSGWQIAKGRFGEPSEGAIEPIQEDEVRRLIQAAIEGGVIERLPGRRIEANFNRQVIKTPCLKCDGTGQLGAHDELGNVPGDKCPDCDGDGHGCTVMMVGFIDVEFRDMIQDHKTTKSMKWAKSPNKLSETIQMLIYAHEILEKAKDRGEPIPDKVTLRHNVFCAPENKVRKTEVVVTREHIEQQWEIIKRNALKMAEFRKLVNAWHEIHDPANPSQACNAYGGCAFRSVCSGQESEESYEKRLARQKELKYSTVSVQGAADRNSQPIIKGTTTVANFNDRLAQMKARNASGGAVAGTIPGSAPSINPPVENAAPPQTAVVQTPATTPTPPAAPTPAAAPAATSPVGNLLPPVAPMDVPGVGMVAPPPWAVPGCNACVGVGFNNKGAPCRICDMKQKVAGKPQSADFHIEQLGDGMVISMEKSNPDRTFTSFITGRPAEAVKTQAKEALAPTGPIAAVVAAAAPAAPVTSPVTSPVVQQHVETPMIQATNLVPVATVTAPPIPGASPLPAEALAASPTLAAQAESKRKRRTKAEMEADAKGEAREQKACEVFAGRMGMILVIGAVASKMAEGFNSMTLDEIFNHFGQEVAKAQGAASYYDLDPFKRRDALAAGAAVIAETVGDTFVFADPQTPDTKALLEALRSHAAMVIVAIK